MITDAFRAKVAAALKKPGANMQTVAAKLGVSASTVYRASGGKKRAAANMTWAPPRKARPAPTRKATKRKPARKARAA